MKIISVALLLTLVVTFPAFSEEIVPAAPEVATPAAPTPVAPAPEVAAPFAPTPVTPAPEVAAPFAPTPVTPAPEAAAPIAPTPVTPAPEVAAPVAPTPVAPAPEVAAPIAPVPVTPAPEVAAPVAPAPLTPALEIAAPVAPAPVEPATEVVAPTTPNIDTPEADTPETGIQDAETPADKIPDSDMPVIGAPTTAPVGVAAVPTDVGTTTSASIANNKGFYASADLGILKYSNTASAYDNGAFPNTGELSIGGGYHFSHRVGVEAGYSSIGNSGLKSSSTVALTESIKASALHVAAVGTYVIDNQIDVFAKLGFANTQLNYNFSCAIFTPPSGTGSGSKTNLMYGLGGLFSFDYHYSVRVQYENYGNTTLTNTYSNGTTKSFNIGIMMLSVGGVYNF